MWQKHDSGLGVALRVAWEKESKATCVFTNFTCINVETVSGRNSGFGPCHFLEAIGEVNMPPGTAGTHCWKNSTCGYHSMVKAQVNVMLRVTVALLSGQSETLSLAQSSKVGDLQVLAQKLFQRGFLRLVNADHSVVDPTLSLQAAGLEDGDHLTAIVIEAKVAKTHRAFALFCSGGDRVVTRGNPKEGGDSSEVQDQLKGVQQVQATRNAFAAILSDGSVVSWGHPKSGGDSSEVQDQLKGVRQVQANDWAFAAILANGSVVTWGGLHDGGDSSYVQDRLKGVQQVQASAAAFAAILADGSVVTWGDPRSGGDSSFGTRPAERCPADSRNSFRVCCDPGGWDSGDLGPSSIWW